MTKQIYDLFVLAATVACVVQIIVLGLVIGTLLFAILIGPIILASGIGNGGIFQIVAGTLLCLFGYGTTVWLGYKCLKKA